VRSRRIECTMHGHIDGKTCRTKGSTLIAAIKLYSSSCLLVTIGVIFDLGRIHLSTTLVAIGVSVSPGYSKSGQ
jgi:hypothetical protein